MIDRKVIEVTVNEEEITSAKCEWCGKECCFKKLFIQGGVMRVEFGFGSKNDGDIYEGCICDDCFEKELKPKLKKVPN